MGLRGAHPVASLNLNSAAQCYGLRETMTMSTAIEPREYIEAAAYFYWTEDGCVGYDTGSSFDRQLPSPYQKSPAVSPDRPPMPGA